MPRSSLAHILDPPRPIADSESRPSVLARPFSSQTPAQSPAQTPAQAVMNTPLPRTTSAPAPAPAMTMSTTQFIAYEPNILPLPEASAAPRRHTASPASQHAPPRSNSLTQVAAITSSLPPTTGVSPSSTPGTNVYVCRDCGRSYSRPEHLVRHVQSHTLGRRFTCEVCLKSFARKDLLTRHAANHQNDPLRKRRRISDSQRAARVTQACRACATARVKCDDTKPCRRCVSRQMTCDSSAEPGSAAAIHLAHAASSHPVPYHHHHHNNTNSNTNSGSNSLAVSVSGDSASPCSPASLDQPRYMAVGPSLAAHDPTNKNTPASQASLRSDESQLPMLGSNAEQGNAESYPPVLDGNQQANLADMNRVPFFDFLRDMLYQQPFSPDKLPDSQGSAVLDFCNDANMELTDMDFSLLDFWNLDNTPTADAMPMPTLTRPETSGQHAQGSGGMAQMRRDLVKVWTGSPWRWDPAHHDSGYREQGNLPVPANATTSMQLEESSRKLGRVLDDKLDQSSRDRVLAVVLSTCRQSTSAGRVAASFPTVDVMDTMVHMFLAAHGCQVSTWIHFPTFALNTQWPEWIGVAAAAGAILTSVLTLRKFGFAVQEAVRISIPARFEENNTAIQNLGLVQALVLGQDLGLWSGNRRKMEIAECHLVIPVTMMRYRRKFQRSSYPLVTVEPSDEGQVLEDKWRLWVQGEQWKRLVFHCFIREAQISMTTLTNPCMSYAELTLPLPEPRELWFAKTAADWKAQYLVRYTEQSCRAPSVGDLIQDVRQLLTNNTRLDMQLSISVFLHGFWSMILEYRQLSAVHHFRSYTKSNTANPLLSSRHEELIRALQAYSVVSQEWQDKMSAQEHAIYNLLMVNLHVSLDDLQLFSGKGGEDEARRIYPVLQEWAASSDGRSAVWYAGQVLRYAKLFPPGHLKDFYAVAVHHASLALWTYGVISRANRRDAIAVQYGYRPVYLDGASVTAAQRFLGQEQGQPLIQGPASGDGGAAAVEASLYDPRACMEITHEILQSNFRRAREVLPPIVENLCRLIRQLGNAAWAVGLS